MQGLKPIGGIGTLPYVGQVANLPVIYRRQ
jgi:hypothetical protein